jgi:hypothetical protein
MVGKYVEFDIADMDMKTLCDPVFGDRRWLAHGVTMAVDTCWVSETAKG